MLAKFIVVVCWGKSVENSQPQNYNTTKKPPVGATVDTSTSGTWYHQLWEFYGSLPYIEQIIFVYFNLNGLIWLEV